MASLSLDFSRPVTLNRTVDPADAPRLSKQCALILERLRKGPATNVELVHIAMNLTGRISDLRANGYAINAVRGDGGVWTYSLVRK